MNDQPNALAQELEEMEDQRDAVAAMLARIETANQERLPWEMVKRLCAGKNPLLVWREYRGLTAEVLAEKASLDAAEVHAIESGAEPRLRVAAALAKALDIDAEDLIPWPQN
jgi:DNA-binding XRE family transcriptional regulator